MNIRPNQANQAIAERDRLISAWANRYHQPQGVPLRVQMACGLAQPGDAVA